MEFHCHETIQIFYKAFIWKPILSLSTAQKQQPSFLVAYLSRLLQLLAVVDSTALIADLHLGAVVQMAKLAIALKLSAVIEMTNLSISLKLCAVV